MVGIKHIRLVVVDDSLPFLRSFCSLLNRYPQVEVVAAESNPLKALKDLEELKPDLVVMDFHMRGMHGLEAISRIRDRFPDIHVIMLTAHDTPELRQASLAVGSNGFISKSRLMEDLPAALEKVVRSVDRPR